MSHFSVAVLTFPHEGYEDVLAPYEEDNDEFVSFIDKTDEVLKEYKESGFYFFQNLNKTKTVNVHAHEVYRKIPYGSGSLIGRLAKTYPVKKGWHKIYVPYKRAYKDLDEYVEEIYGYEWDESHERCGYYANAQAKWDWFNLGGRWQGALLVKEACDDQEIGEAAAFGNRRSNLNIPGYKWVDQARLGDIEWDKMREYDLATLKPYEEFIHNMAYRKNQYPTEDSYIERNISFVTFAFLSSEIGWVECSNGTAGDTIKWDMSMYDTYLKNANPNYVLSIIDCHS